jgi:hypothetical protein
MAISSSNISGKRLEFLLPLQKFSKAVPISIALIIIGGFGLWVASQNVKAWGAKKTSLQASAASLTLAIRRAVFELFCSFKRLSDLWDARKQPPSQDLSSSLNTQLEFLQTGNLTSKEATLSAVDLITSTFSPESKDQPEILYGDDACSLPKPLEKNASFIETPPEAASSEFLTPQPLATSSSYLTSFSQTEFPDSTVPVSTLIKNPTSVDIDQLSVKPATVSPLVVSSSKTTYKVPFYLTTVDGGYIGNPSRFVKAYPKFLNLKMEDGSPLTLDSHDFLAPISVSYESCPVDVARFPNPLYIPYNFLKDKQDGDTFTLKYKDITFLCTVNQYAHHDTEMHDSFKKILSLITAYVKSNHQIEEPLYGRAHDPTWFYQLGNQGSIFKMNHSRSQLEERPSTEFRTKNNPIFPRGTVLLQNGRCIFTCFMPLISPENVDIILNDTLLMFYARIKMSSLPNQIPSDALVNAKLNPPSSMNEGEWFFGISWNERPEFKQFELVQLKEKILQGVIHCQSGRLIFSFPLLESSPDRILFETMAR